MTSYYVATLTRYVLVDVADEAEARKLGHAALQELHAELRERLGKEVPINILVVRPATSDEIDMMKWHREMCDKEGR